MTADVSIVPVEQLRTGDQLHHDGALFDVIGVQPTTLVGPTGDRVLVGVYVTLDEPQGPPVTMVGLDGTVLAHHPYRTVLYRPGVPVCCELQERPA